MKGSGVRVPASAFNDACNQGCSFDGALWFVGPVSSDRGARPSMQ